MNETLAKPGTPGAVCIDEDCGHVRCAKTRWIACHTCKHCEEWIWYDRAFHRDGSGDLVHVECERKAGS